MLAGQENDHFEIVSYLLMIYLQTERRDRAHRKNEDEEEEEEKAPLRKCMVFQWKYKDFQFVASLVVEICSEVGVCLPDKKMIISSPFKSNF